LLSLYLPPFLNSSVLSIFTFLFYLSIYLSESSTLIFYLFSFFFHRSLWTIGFSDRKAVLTKKTFLDNERDNPKDERKVGWPSRDLKTGEKGHSIAIACSFLSPQIKLNNSFYFFDVQKEYIQYRTKLTFYSLKVLLLIKTGLAFFLSKI
jgi:hypothetical protein